MSSVLPHSRRLRKLAPSVPSSRKISSPASSRSAKVLNSDDEITKKTKVLQILVSLPGVGKVTAQKAMEEIGIAENRRIGGLGSAQKEKLIERFGK